MEETTQQSSNRKRIKYIILISLGLIVFLSAALFFLHRYRFTKYLLSESAVEASSKYTFGIDISQYQGYIHWNNVKKSHHPIKFVFIRATMGTNKTDKYFSYNWRNAKNYNFIRGAYHYYRPHENSTKQFRNFAARVKLKKGDLPPVLDIEAASKYGSKNLRAGILNWLKLAEKKYGVKPIIYTSRNFYLKYLMGHVRRYPLWIAAYAGKHKVKWIKWTFHQFSTHVKVKGIPGTVDGDDFKGSLSKLKSMCVK